MFVLKCFFPVYLFAVFYSFQFLQSQRFSACPVLWRFSIRLYLVLHHVLLFFNCCCSFLNLFLKCYIISPREISQLFLCKCVNVLHELEGFILYY